MNESKGGSIDDASVLPPFLYDVIFRPSLIPSADALKEHGLETGGTHVGNTLVACGEEDFPCSTSH